MNKCVRAAAVAGGLLAIWLARVPADGIAPGNEAAASIAASIRRQVLLASWPGPREGLPGFLAAGAPALELPAYRAGPLHGPDAAFGPLAGSVTVPGLSARNRTADTVHMILGWATVIAGGLTGILNPEVAGYDVHHVMGWTSAGLAAATLAAGAWAHHGDVGPANGLGTRNVHALLGITGGLMMMAAPLAATGSGSASGEDEGELHAALGEGGELLMGVAIAWPLVF